MIGKFGREDQLSAINESRVAKNFKKIDSEAGKLEEFKHDKQKWLSMNNMTNKLSLRLNDSTYQDLIDRLNVLYPIQSIYCKYTSFNHVGLDEEVNAVLEPFADQKKYFASIKPPVLELDEFGRSFTSASRKTSKAQVWIVPGQGQIYVNGQSMATYFSLINWRASIVKPFEVAHKLGQFNVWAISHGGGLTGILCFLDHQDLFLLGQAEAIQVAIARGIVVHDPDAEPLLESGKMHLFYIHTKSI